MLMRICSGVIKYLSGIFYLKSLSGAFEVVVVLEATISSGL